MKVITFGTVTIHYCYPISLSLSCFCSYIFNSYYINVQNQTPRRLNLIFLDTLSLIVCGLFGLISKERSNTKLKMNSLPKANLAFHFSGLIIITAFFHCSSFFLLLSITFSLEFGKIIQVIICLFLCKLTLKIPIFKHHYISIAFDLLISIIMMIIRICYDFPLFTIRGYLSEVVSTLVYYTVYTSMEIYEKYIMTIFLIPPYFLLFFKGITQLIIIVFLFGICSLFTNGTEVINIGEMYNAPLGQVLLVFMSYLSLNIFRIQTIFNYSPSYRYVADIAVVLYICIYTLIFGGDISKKLYVLFIVLNILIIIGILVYQEIIMINVCGMSDYTKTKIDERAEKEENIVKEELNSSSFLE